MQSRQHHVHICARAAQSFPVGLHGILIPLFKGRPASTSQSRSVLLTILHGGHIPGADNAPHMFLMAGVVVSGWKLDFVGTLDTIDHD